LFGQADLSSTASRSRRHPLMLLQMQKIFMQYFTLLRYLTLKKTVDDSSSFGRKVTALASS
jgi:hypothetical protein